MAGYRPLYYNNSSSGIYTTTASSTPSTWSFWNNTLLTTSSTATSYDLWGVWCGTNSSISYQYTPAPPLTPEQVAERRAAAALRTEELAFAKGRARLLLVENLTDEQREEFERAGQFHVRSQRGRRYCLRLGRTHNVFEVDRVGQRLTEICCHVRDAVPDEDNLLAQKLALELMEDDFLRTANRWDLTRGRQQLVAA